MLSLPLTLATIRGVLIGLDLRESEVNQLHRTGAARQDLTCDRGRPAGTQRPVASDQEAERFPGAPAP
jgi:hypothetical protein